MERIVTDGPACRLLHPPVEGRAQRLPLVLDRKINQRGGSTEGGGTRARLKVVRAGGSSERHVEVRVHVDPTRQQVSSRGIDHASGVVPGQVLTNHRNLAVADRDVARIGVRSRDHAAIRNDRVEAHAPSPEVVKQAFYAKLPHPWSSDSPGQGDTMEFGITIKPDMTVDRIVALTRQAEEAGFQYGWIFDSHVLWLEPYPLLTLMAANTKSMHLGTFVTNPAVRDITVTASLFATLTVVSGGRMALGL